MKKNLFILSLTVLLAACAGTKVNRDGSPEGEVVWPDVDKVTFDHRRGTFVNLENLSKIRPGLTRDDLYDLLGRPHFTEGFHVREWTYLFYFNTPGRGTDGVSACQYKILFDKDYLARNFYWKPIDPVDGHCPPVVEKQGSYSLDADALFDFDRYDLAAINARGRESLDNLAEHLRGFSEIRHISVDGYTDHLGSSSYNSGLSQRRAQTVSDYLVSLGVAAEVIRAQGHGESNPVVGNCSSAGGRAALIDCLAPNRRVEVKVDGYGLR